MQTVTNPYYQNHLISKNSLLQCFVITNNRIAPRQNNSHHQLPVLKLPTTAKSSSQHFSHWKKAKKKEMIRKNLNNWHWDESWREWEEDVRGRDLWSSVFRFLWKWNLFTFFISTRASRAWKVSMGAAWMKKFSAIKNYVYYFWWGIIGSWRREVKCAAYEWIQSVWIIDNETFRRRRFPIQPSSALSGWKWRNNMQQTLSLEEQRFPQNYWKIFGFWWQRRFVWKC